MSTAADVKALRRNAERAAASEGTGAVICTAEFALRLLDEREELIAALDRLSASAWLIADHVGDVGGYRELHASASAVDALLSKARGTT